MSKSSEADQFASTVAFDLRQAEQAVDFAGVRLAEMIAAGLSGRTAAGLAAEVGQRAFSSAAKALHTLTEARGELVQAHGHAERDARRMGLCYAALVPGESKPTGGETGSTTPTGRQAVA